MWGKNKKYKRIAITADWHITDTTPPCRLDENYVITQMEKILFIRNYLLQNDIHDLIIAGDLTEKWTVSFYLLKELIFVLGLKNLNVYVIAGNHDMPNHNEELMEKKSVLSFLDFIGKVIMIDYNEPYEIENTPFVLHGWNYGKEISVKKRTLDQDKINIAIIHEFIAKSGDPILKIVKEAQSSSHIKKKFKNFNLVVSGHNHKTFTDGNLINPGSLTRHKSDQGTHKPCFFIYNGESYEKIYIPIKQENFQRIENEDSLKNEEFEELIKDLSESIKVNIDIMKNLKSLLDEPNIPKEVKTIIRSNLP